MDGRQVGHNQRPDHSQHDMHYGWHGDFNDPRIALGSATGRAPMSVTARSATPNSAPMRRRVLRCTGMVLFVAIAPASHSSVPQTSHGHR
jgi:hypothetical protein